MFLKGAFINLQQVLMKAVLQTGTKLGALTCDPWLCDFSFIWKAHVHG